MAKILIIDDDPAILRLLEFSLERAGHMVIISADGQQGMAQVEAEKPDLVVADVMMPNMTGYEFCKQIRARPEAQETPIIIFSARFQPVDKQTALQAGATDYLPKTSSPDALVKRIQELLPAETRPVTNKTIGFFSLRGGVGVTSLAINTATALAVSHKTDVALIDLAKMGGHAALMLGLRPTSSIARLLSSHQGKFTPASIRPHLIEHSAGIQLLASAPAYQQQFSFEDSHLERMSAAVRTGFAYAIFDIASSMLESYLAGTLQEMDRLALVLSPDMPSLQSTAIALQGLAQLGVPDSKVSLVVNHVVAQSNLPLETIQKAIKRPIAATIPHEPDMIKAINSGKPFLLNSPKSAGAAAIARLAETLTR